MYQMAYTSFWCGGFMYTGDFKRNIVDFITDFSRTVLYLIATVFLLWLNRYAIVRGRHLYSDASQLRMLFLRLIILFGLVVVSVLAGFAMEKTVSKNTHWEKIVVAVCCLIFWGVCTWWVSMVPYKLEADQLIVWQNSALASQDNFIMQSYGGQMFLYPQQLGLSFLYELLFRITGRTDHKLIGYCTAAMAPLTLFAGYQCAKEGSGIKAAMRFLPLMMLCLPYIIYSPYVYGDIPAISYSFVLVWLVLKFTKTKKLRYAVCACVAAALALLGRMNFWIVLIGVTIGLVYHALAKREYKMFLFAACILLSAYGSVKGVQYYNSYRSGYPVAEGMPSVLWVAMGLQEGGDAFGQYNNYSLTVYRESGFDKELSREIGNEEVKNRLQAFLNDPAYASAFFQEKMYVQWHDALFESIVFTSSFEYPEDEPPKEIVSWVYSEEGSKAVERFSSHMLCIVYFFSIIGVAGRYLKKEPIIEDIPLIIFVGGFLFSIFWEAKARYVFPYFVLLHLYAAYGLTYVTEMVEVRVKRFHNERNKVKITN